jgi:hypothetical protein
MKKEIPLIEFHQGLPTMDTLTAARYSILSGLERKTR